MGATTVLEIPPETPPAARSATKRRVLLFSLQEEKDRQDGRKNHEGEGSKQTNEQKHCTFPLVVTVTTSERKVRWDHGTMMPSSWCPGSNVGNFDIRQRNEPGTQSEQPGQEKPAGGGGKEPLTVFRRSAH